MTPKTFQTMFTARSHVHKRHNGKNSCEFHFTEVSASLKDKKRNSKRLQSCCFNIFVRTVALFTKWPSVCMWDESAIDGRYVSCTLQHHWLSSSEKSSFCCWRSANRFCSSRSLSIWRATSSVSD